MKFAKTKTFHSRYWYHFLQFLCLIPIVITFHYCKNEILNKLLDFRYNQQTSLEVIDISESQYKKLFYETMLLRQEIGDIREELRQLQAWKNDFLENFDQKLSVAFDVFYSDQVGMFDYASEYAGGSIISTPETISHLSTFDGFRFFGSIDWMFESQPSTILKASLPGKCYAFYGDKGRILMKLGRPIIITHISLEYFQIGESGTSAPKDFQIFGFGEYSIEENLGNFLYNLSGKVIQTFQVIPKNQTFKSVELRILSNHGNEELTCVYRFRVHSLNLNKN